MLTKESREDIERVQKIVLKIVLAQRYISYEEACKTLQVESLEERRQQICLNFALSCLKSDRFKSFFPLNSELGYPIEREGKFKTPFCHTERYRKSPIPYLISLLNKYYSTLP